MPRNGSGTYTLPVNSFNPAVTTTTIESSSWNSTANDLASALTQSISKDGQTPWTGNDDHGGNKIVNLGNGTISTDAMAYGQGAKLSGANTFTGDQTINGSVSLSGSLTVTGPVIFSSGTITVGTLTVTSGASVASMNVTGTSNLNLLNVASTASLGGTTNANILNVASVASLNTLTVASTAAIAVLSVGSSIVVGAASGGSKGAGTINATGIYINGTSVTASSGVAFSANKAGSNQSISSAADVKITATTEEFDVGGYYDAPNSKFTPLVAGKYYFVLNVTMTSTNITTGQPFIGKIFKNGSAVKTRTIYSSAAGQLLTVTVAATLDANGTTDFFEAYVNCTSALGAMSADGTATVTWFEGYRVA